MAIGQELNQPSSSGIVRPDRAGVGSRVSSYAPVFVNVMASCHGRHHSLQWLLQATSLSTRLHNQLLNLTRSDRRLLLALVIHHLQMRPTQCKAVRSIRGIGSVGDLSPSRKPGDIPCGCRRLTSSRHLQSATWHQRRAVFEVRRACSPSRRKRSAVSRKISFQTSNITTIHGFAEAKLFLCYQDSGIR